ncbi:hypothetical protein [Methylobacterium sp.]|uniref:hypothetical protein n=1 Tax=Methylobacterium sp. TaxID=409 RepID=UPI003B02A395
MERSTKPKATNTNSSLGSIAADPGSSPGIRKPRRRLPAASSVRTRADEAISMPVEAVFDFERLDFIVVDGSGRFSGHPWIGVTTDGATGAVLDAFCEFNG